MIVCVCNNISDSDVRNIKDKNTKTLDIFKQLNKKPKCGSCCPFIKEILEMES